MTNVNVYEAKSRLSHLLNLVAQGEEVVISRAGKPMARLVPFAEAVPRRPGRLKGQGRVDPSFFEPLPDEIQSGFE